MMSTQWTLPKDLISASVEVMKPHGMYGNEGLALWFGTENEAHITVTHMVELHGPGFRTSPLNLQISLAGMSALTELAQNLNAYLIGQIHSHPRNFIDLSEVDVVHGIRIPDYLSLVCPHYAQAPNTTLAQCGVHVFEAGTYRRLSAGEVSRRISSTSALVNKITLEVPA